MGFFSLKDIYKNGKPYLFFQSYCSSRYKENVRKKKPGKDSGTTYQNMSRNNVTICLGPYSTVLNERFLKARVLEKAMKHLVSGNITEGDLGIFEEEFKVTEELEENLFEDFAFINFKRFLENKEIRRYVLEMTEADKQEAVMKNQSLEQWAATAYELGKKGTISDIRDELGVGPTKANNEYLRRKFVEYGEPFAKEYEEMAKVAERKIKKLSQ